MKKENFTAILPYLMRSFFLVSLILSCQLVFAQDTKVVFVIADGIPTDVIEEVNTPALDAIAKVGGYARAHVGGDKGEYSQTPTISAVGYNSLLTGTWVNKHNVWDNEIAAPNYNYWTIFRFFREQYPEKRTAVFSSWEDNRTRLLGENKPETGNLKLNYHFDGLERDQDTYPQDNDRLFMHYIDEAVANNAALHIKMKAPDLSWVYLEFTDDMGHKYGDSKELIEAVKMMDDQIARLWKSIQYRQENFDENWVIYVTTDHGRDASTGRNHGGQSDRERMTWIYTNDSNLNSYFKSGEAAVVDIMPTMANLLNLTIPFPRKAEIDGIPLNTKLSAKSPKLQLEGNKLHVSWEPLEEVGEVKIYLADTNHFKEGKKDNYQLKKTVPLREGKSTISIEGSPSDFYKVVIEAPHNMLNRWWFSDK